MKIRHPEHSQKSHTIIVIMFGKRSFQDLQRLTKKLCAADEQDWNIVFMEFRPEHVCNFPTNIEIPDFVPEIIVQFFN